MKDFGEFEKIIGIVPKLSFVVYIIGFIVLQLHLNKYNIYENNILSFEYLKVGILFLAFFSPVFIAVGLSYYYLRLYRETLLSEQSTFPVIRAIVRMLPIMVCFFYAFAYLIIFQFTGIYELKMETAYGWLLNFLPYLIMIVLIFLSVVFFKRKKADFIISLVLYSAFFFYIAYFTDTHQIEQLVLLSVLLTTFAFTSNLENHILKDVFGRSELLQVIYPSIFLLAISIPVFGFYVYRSIPQSFGGGTPYTKQLIIEKSLNIDSSDSLTISALRDTNVRIIYENADNYYITMNDVSYTLAKKHVLAEHYPYSDILREFNRRQFKYKEDIFNGTLSVDSMEFENGQDELFDN